MGRDRELGVLQAGFAQATAETTCRLVTILGAAGVGKTRLVDDFTSSLGERAHVLHARCLSYGEGITFWPISEVVRTAAAITDEDSAERARAKLSGILEAAPDATLIGQRVGSLIGIGEPAADVHEGFWAVRRFLEILAAKAPVVVVLDDIHWAETTFLDLVDYIVEFSRDAAILLLCMGRPELLDIRSDWGRGHANATSTVIAPLAASDSEILVENLLGGSDLPSEARQEIAQGGQGNPLFLEEIVRMWIDDGVLERHDGRWVARSEISRVSVPPTINALLAARLDRLETRERDILQRASVVGQVFWWGSVAELSPDDLRDSVGTCLQALVRKELIRPDRSAISAEDAFRFTHILIRDTAYNSLPKATRAELHERFASWLERRVRDRVSEYDEIIGYHLEQACRQRASLGMRSQHDIALATAAGRRLCMAGRKAFARQDMKAAVGLLSRAKPLLPEGDPERLELIPILGEALMESGELAQADRVLVEARDEARLASDPKTEARVTILELMLQTLTSGTTAAEFLAGATESIKLLEGFGDDLGLAKSWRLVSLAHLTEDHFEPMAEALERALWHARRGGDGWEEANSLSWLALIANFGPASVEHGLRRCEHILQHSPGDSRPRAYALVASAVLMAMRGEFEQAQTSMGTGRAILAELGLTISFGATSIAAGLMRLLCGDPSGAEQDLREGYEVLERMGERSFLSTVAGMLAQALYAQGRYDEAHRFTLIGEETAAPDDVASEIEWRAARAKVLARWGEFETAETMARQAASLAQRGDDIEGQARTLMDLAEVLYLASRADVARSAVQRALALFERKGNVVSTARARKVLDELTGAAPTADSWIQHTKSRPE